MELYRAAQQARAFRWPLLACLVLLPCLFGCGSGPISPGAVVEQLLIGILLGSVYALIALGYTLVYGVIKLINFAHCDIYMVGAFTGYYVLRLSIRYLTFNYGASLITCFIISILVSVIVCAVLAVVMERLAYRPLRKGSRIAALITAVGVSFLLENLGINVFGANPKSYEPKTLEVYQIAVADNEAFDQADIIEVRDSTQRSFFAKRFTKGGYVRARLVCQSGISEWGPALHVNLEQPGGFVELNEPPTGSPPMLPSIGFTRIKEHGEDMVAVNWAQGSSESISMRPVFSHPDGKMLAYTLPIKSASGADVRLPVLNLVIVGVTLLILAALNLLVNRSMFGICMRALSFDINAAKLMGVDTDRVISQTFAIGGACAAVAGNMVGVYNQTIEPLMGILPGMKAFVAAVVGGIGSIPGAAVGGLIMGVSEALVKGAMPKGISALSDAFAFAILILVLLFRPSGIFGRTHKEKV
jgi:branched-subunit amino acid ABC-type transport system permease component